MSFSQQNLERLKRFLSLNELTNKYLDGLIGVRDEGDEERQHHVNEQGDEGVEVRTTEEPHQRVFVLQLGEGGEHVVTVQQREQTLSHTAQPLKLEHMGESTWTNAQYSITW